MDEANLGEYQGSAKIGLEFGRRIQEAAVGRPVASYGKACLAASAIEGNDGLR